MDNYSLMDNCSYLICIYYTTDIVYIYIHICVTIKS